VSLPTVDSEYDYATYAPPGTKCTKCGQDIKRDQVARRSTDGDETTYRHFPEDCPKGKS
jgi:hypothetical protein